MSDRERVLRARKAKALRAERRGRQLILEEASLRAGGYRTSEIDAIEEKLLGLRAKSDVAGEDERKADERKKEAARRVEEARNSPGTQALETRIRNAERDGRKTIMDRDF